MVLSIESDIEARAKAERQLRAAGLAREELARYHRDEALADAGEAPIGHGPERDATALKMEGIDVDKLIGVKGPSSDAQDKVLRAEARRTDEDTRMRAQEPMAAADLRAPSPIAPPPSSNPMGVSITALLGEEITPSKVPDDPAAKAAAKAQRSSSTTPSKPTQDSPRSTSSSAVLVDRDTDTNAKRAQAQAEAIKPADEERERKAAEKASSRSSGGTPPSRTGASTAPNTPKTPDVGGVVKDSSKDSERK